ncbi:hypothetical protein AB0J37_00145 [Microbispora rosea]|uniref:hypothetical protein n=1 Tax=Microbispora rosea TaxID=58117 RepID=UPI0034390880
MDGEQDYQDVGLSSGLCAGDVCEPPVNTRFPAYHGLEILGTTGRPGDDLIMAASNEPKVAVQAVRQADGDLAVVLVNEDPAASYPIRLRYAVHHLRRGLRHVHLDPRSVFTRTVRARRAVHADAVALLDHHDDAARGEGPGTGAGARAGHSDRPWTASR